MPEPHDVTLVREAWNGPSVSGRMIGADLGYLRIATFRAGAPAELQRKALELRKSGAASLLIDLRRTAEGPLENGLAAARLFVKSGTLAIKAGRDKADRTEVQAAATDGTIDLPVTLLVTNGTTGAAELFIAAIDGNGRGEILGERTLGRAGLQKLVQLPENRGLWLTYARYLTPAGEPIHGRGLEPDVRIEEPTLEFGAAAPDQDVMLDAALEHLRTKKAA